MQCSGATGACRRGGRAAGSAAAAAATSITAAWHPQQHPATQRPYEWLRRPLSLRCGAGPFGVPCLRPPGPRSGGSCVLSSASTGFAGASQSAASACFASAAAAVPIAVAAGSRAAVAAAARQTGALAASGAAATEEMQQVDVGGGLVRGVKGRGPEGRSDNPASLPEGGTAEGTASGVVLQQDEQQQQQQHGTTAGPLKEGVPLGAAFWGAGAVGCTIWALAYMRQHNMSFTGGSTSLWFACSVRAPERQEVKERARRYRLRLCLFRLREGSVAACRRADDSHTRPHAVRSRGREFLRGYPTRRLAVYSTT